jgi:alkylation response protein AidB-like acyl-CoA dehydrogenase
MTTRARKSGDEYILNGEKMWITSGSIADVAVIWAKLEDEGGGDKAGDGAACADFSSRPTGRAFHVKRYSRQMVAARFGDQRPDA